MIKQATLELAKLVSEGVRDFSHLGHIRTQVMFNPQSGDEMVMLNYSHEAMFANLWNEYECASRGLVVREDGEILCLPFDKFFNYGQSTNGGTTVHLPTTDIVEVWEKMDGSLLNVWWDGDMWRTTTRGSFESEQAVVGQAFVNRMNMSDVDKRYTFMFEVIYPENRIVVDYEGFQGLVLLGARALPTGQYARSETLETMKRWYFDYSYVLMPKMYSNFDSFEDIVAILPALDPNNEGFVVLTENGERFKFKGQAYLIAHKILTNLSEKSVVEQLKLGTYDTYVGMLPDEFRHEVDSIGDQLREAYNVILAEVEAVFEVANKEDSRKEFAAIAGRSKVRSLVFLKLDGRLTDEAIWKYIEKNLKN